jgi:anti-anti-sigma factor
MINPDDRDLTVVEPPALPSAAFIREHADFHDVIHVYGDVDLSNSSELEHAISGLRSVDRGVVVDLSNCVYMDSTALTVLVRAKKNLGHDFRIFTQPSGNVARLLEVSGLSGFLN